MQPAFRQAMAEHGAQGLNLNIGVFHAGYNSAAAPVMGADGRPAFGLTCAGSAVTHTPAFLRRGAGPAVLALARALGQPGQTS